MAILGDFQNIDEHAREVGRHPRTLRRWLDAADGLPHARDGAGRLLFKVEWTRGWLEGRRVQRNPRQPAKRGRRA